MTQAATEYPVPYVVPIVIPDIMTAKEVAEIYFQGKMSLSTVYHLVKIGEMPHLQISSKKLYFKRKKLDEWMDKQTFIPGQEEEYGRLRQVK